MPKNAYTHKIEAKAIAFIAFLFCNQEAGKSISQTTNTQFKILSGFRSFNRN